MLSRIESTGIELAVVGDNQLEVTGEITEQQRQFLKANKPYLVAALKLRAMAPAADQPELLDWYQDDMAMIAELGLEQLQYLVDDYLNRGRYDNE